MTAHILLSQCNIYDENNSIENILTIKLKKCVHLKMNALSSRTMSFNFFLIQGFPFFFNFYFILEYS